MKDGGGVLQHCHPILACYIGDYPEQVLVTGTKMMDCPKCNIPANQLGSLMEPYELWDHQEILNVLALVDLDPQSFWETCKKLHIKPIFQPFFVHLPYMDIFQAIMPDILHQLHQGVLKHLLSWLVQAYRVSEINTHTQCLIPNHHIQIFSSSITNLS